MVNRCGGTPLLLLSLEPCTHTCTNTHIEYCNTQSGGRKGKTTIWSKFLGWPRWLRQVLRRKAELGENHISFWNRPAKRGCVRKFYFTLWFCRNACLQRSQNESEEWSAQPDLWPSRAGQSCWIWQWSRHEAAALGSTYGRWMGSALLSPANPYSTLSKQPPLCTYLHREELLHNSTNMLNSICALTYRLGEESKWKVSVMAECVAMLFLQWAHSWSWINMLLQVEIFLIFVTTVKVSNLSKYKLPKSISGSLS